MKKTLLLFALVLLIACLSFVFKQNSKTNDNTNLSVGFYNLENLFDTVDDSSHNDNDFTPNGKYLWTKSRFQNKILNLNKVISSMVDGDAPDVLGVCELENAQAFSDLLDTKGLKNRFGIVHYNSPY
jgi:hypothetical protein